MPSNHWQAPDRRSNQLSLAVTEISAMRHSLLAITLLLLSATTQAQTLKATSNIVVRALDRTVDFTSDTTTSIRDMKVVIDARDDAASFVASAGEIRGAQLEAALGAIRERLPETREASDQALAEAILAR
jgi:uncharacterized protein (TIGR02448 family)